MNVRACMYYKRMTGVSACSGEATKLFLDKKTKKIVPESQDTVGVVLCQAHEAVHQ